MLKRQDRMLRGDFNLRWTIHSENFQTGPISEELDISATQSSAVSAPIAWNAHSRSC
jgi:hypothetical protein